MMVDAATTQLSSNGVTREPAGDPKPEQQVRQVRAGNVDPAAQNNERVSTWFGETDQRGSIGGREGEQRELPLGGEVGWIRPVSATRR
jgi:hypothetical protein